MVWALRGVLSASGNVAPEDRQVRCPAPEQLQRVGNLETVCTGLPHQAEAAYDRFAGADGVIFPISLDT